MTAPGIGGTPLLVGPLVIALGAGGTAVLLLIWAVQLARKPRTLVRARVEAMLERTPYAAGATRDVLRDRRASGLRAFDLLLRGRAWTAEQRRLLDRAGLELRVGEYVAIRLAAAALLATLIGLAVGHAAPALAVLASTGGALVGIIAPALWLRRRLARRRDAIEHSLLELCDMMASMLQSGFAYMQALSMAADQIEGPLSDELRQMRDAVRLGAGIDDALEQMNERLGSADFDMMATAIAIQRRTGGSLAGILRSVAETIRDRQLFRLEVAAMTSRERYSALIVAALPPVIAGLLMLIAPGDYMRLLTDRIGNVILGIALTSDAVGYLAIKRATRLEV